ncbi:hypothetical protein MUK42_37439 [Musa troglodytarum]|uniref:Cytidyltransferase-like domain-containing protein n=1 Tax=Musa troglodytarum TaxID=320322 RepID=A0A9E7HQD5_9LILI|nr:hypothetical protein MUK42_37439 [Musa troglodytarum]
MKPIRAVKARPVQQTLVIPRARVRQPLRSSLLPSRPLPPSSSSIPCPIGGHITPRRFQHPVMDSGFVDAPLPMDKISLSSVQESTGRIGIPERKLQSSNLYALALVCCVSPHAYNLSCAESLKVMLLCGSDLLESFATPGVWMLDQVRTICRDFGIVCIRREGKDIEKIISSDEILQENKNNIFSVDEIVPNQISSTRVRDCIRRGLSVKYLTPDEVIDYIKDQKLYVSDS